MLERDMLYRMNEVVLDPVDLQVRRDGKGEVPVARKSVSGDFPWKPSLTQSTTPPFSLSLSSIKVLSLCESEKERWSEPKTAAQI